MRSTKINHPIIIGVGQRTIRERISDPDFSVADLAKMAIDACVEDTGCPSILRHVNSFSFVCSSSEHRESPVHKICEKTGFNPAIREETAVGGIFPQWLVNRAADKITAGEIKIALLAGAELMYRDKKFQKAPDWIKLHERMERDPLIVGEVRWGANDHEMLHGADRPTHVYPLFENALRAHLKMTISEHREFLQTYCDKMAAAAFGNPYAWFNNDKKWKNLAEPTRDNPMFNFPYTKYMNPVPAVNQSAALIVTDTNTARKLGIPKEKWVYLHGGADASDKYYVSQRVHYYSSSVVRFTAEAAFRSANLALSDINFFDLYSCFPCAPVSAALEIGLPINHLPDLSITGGLCFFGGPGNNYTMHSIAHAVERLRKKREEFGFISGLGHLLTEYSIGIYSGREPEKAWSRDAQHIIQQRIDALKSPRFCEKPEGHATVETYTVLHDSLDGEPYSIIIARLDSGERCLATTKKGSALVSQMEKEEFIGYRGHVKNGNDGRNLFD